MNKYIFLDIDEVINSVSSCLEKNLLLGKGNWNIRDESGFGTRELAFLGFIIKHSNVNVVIHSTWRKKYSLDALQKMFNKHGITGERIIDVVNNKDVHFNANRSKRLLIESWLVNKHGENYKNKTKFVVLDDCKIWDEYQILVDSRIGLSFNNMLMIKHKLDLDLTIP